MWLDAAAAEVGLFAASGPLVVGCRRVDWAYKRSFAVVYHAVADEVEQDWSLYGGYAVVPGVAMRVTKV